MNSDDVIAFDAKKAIMFRASFELNLSMILEQSSKGAEILETTLYLKDIPTITYRTILNSIDPAGSSLPHNPGRVDIGPQDTRGPQKCIS